jgi:hypothetical protein
MGVKNPRICVAVYKKGHVPGRASAHVGIRARQDLISSVLATNLGALRGPLCRRREARRGGSTGQEAPSSSLSYSVLSFRTALYSRPSRMPILTARQPARRDPFGCQVASVAHCNAAPRQGVDDDEHQGSGYAESPRSLTTERINT